MPDFLVTGASGFIAGHCIAELASHGYEVRGTVQTSTSYDYAIGGELFDNDAGGVARGGEEFG